MLIEGFHSLGKARNKGLIGLIRTNSDHFPSSLLSTELEICNEQMICYTKGEFKQEECELIEEKYGSIIFFQISSLVLMTWLSNYPSKVKQRGEISHNPMFF